MVPYHTVVGDTGLITHHGFLHTARPLSNRRDQERGFVRGQRLDREEPTF